MILLPRRLFWRLAIAALGAVAAIAGMEWWLRAQEASAADRAPDLVAPPAAESAFTGLLDRGVDIETAILCWRESPDEVAARWQVTTTGQAVLRAAPPPPSGPTRRRLPAAAIALPAAALAELDPLQRAALLELLGSLFAERPVAAARVQLRDVEAQPGELAELLRWIR